MFLIKVYVVIQTVTEGHVLNHIRVAELIVQDVSSFFHLSIESVRCFFIKRNLVNFDPTRLYFLVEGLVKHYMIVLFIFTSVFY